MTEHISTTPFGRRPLSLAMVAGRMAAENCAPGASAGKWQVFRAVCEAKAALGASDRALAVLNALLSFHPDADLVEGEGLVVFPSNAQLALRAHGMAPATRGKVVGQLVAAYPDLRDKILHAVEQGLDCHARHGFVTSVGGWYSYINDVGVPFMPSDGSELVAITCCGIKDLVPADECLSKFGPKLKELSQELQGRLTGAIEPSTQYQTMGTPRGFVDAG